MSRPSAGSRRTPSSARSSGRPGPPSSGSSGGSAARPRGAATGAGKAGKAHPSPSGLSGASGASGGPPQVASRSRPHPAAPSEPARAFLIASYVLGVVLGVALGIYGVFLVPDGPRPGGVLLSVGLLLAVVGNAGAALLIRWLTGTRLGPMTVLIGWTPVVLLFASARPEGDLLLQSSGTAYAFLLLGGLSPIVVAVFGRASRGLTALPPGS